MNSNEIIIQNARLSYAHIWEPFAFDEKDVPKYMVTLLIDKKDEKELKRIQAVIDKVKSDDKSKKKWGGKVPADLRLPIRDGDKEAEEKPEYSGMWTICAKSSEDRAPKIVDRRANPIMDRDEVYSGCYANVKVSFFAFSHKGNNGIGVALNVIQKVKDGERLAGGNNLDGIEDLGDDEDDLG